MPMRIELHLLQNFAPSNLNRDDTGSPKDADFGGVRRARISSQCIKRAVRQYFEKQKLLPPERLAERTKRLAEEVAKRLVAAGRDKAAATRAARAAVTAFLPKSEDKEEHKTPYLLFLGHDEIARFTEVVNQHWDAFSAEPTAEAEPAAEKPSGRGKGRKKTTENGANAPDGFLKAVGNLLDGGKAADLALFGRMLADLPEKNVSAACQVAHAISTNPIHSMEFDYYTAVDDLKPDDNAGADMIGTVEFNSACYYRYANLDVDQLTKNLQGDAELARKTAEAFLRASIESLPTGKQNTFAAHSRPSLVFAVVRSGSPVSLANAFVKPVRPTEKADLVAASAAALDDYYGRLTRMYGSDDLARSAVCQEAGTKLAHLNEEVPSVGEVITAALDAAFNGRAK